MTVAAYRRLLRLVGALWVIGAGGAAAQQSAVTPFVEQGHWSLDAARRLHAAGLTPRGYDPAVEPKTVRELLEAFEHGAARSELAARFRARFEEEFTGLLATLRFASHFTQESDQQLNHDLARLLGDRVAPHLAQLTSLEPHDELPGLVLSLGGGRHHRAA